VTGRGDRVVFIPAALLLAMSSQAGSLLDRLRRPEYTGENRCVPCTAVNIAIAAVLSAAVALLAVPLGAALFGASLLAISLRGYLVPGTPELTERYLPAVVRERFGKTPVQERAAPEPADEYEFEVLERLEEKRQNAVDEETYLTEASVLEVGADGEEYVFTDRFRSVVERHAGDHRGADLDRERLGEIFDIDPARIERLDRDYPAIEVGKRVRKWPSDAALVADLAVHGALLDVTDDWLSVPTEQRHELLEELRGYFETCPVCDGPVAYSEDVVESCCGSHSVTTVACGACGDRLREFDQARVGAREEIKGMTP